VRGGEKPKRKGIFKEKEGGGNTLGQGRLFLGKKKKKKKKTLRVYEGNGKNISGEGDN